LAMLPGVAEKIKRRWVSAPLYPLRQHRPEQRNQEQQRNTGDRHNQIERYFAQPTFALLLVERRSHLAKEPYQRARRHSRGQPSLDVTEIDVKRLGAGVDHGKQYDGRKPQEATRQAACQGDALGADRVRSVCGASVPETTEDGDDSGHVQRRDNAYPLWSYVIEPPRGQRRQSCANHERAEHRDGEHIRLVAHTTAGTGMGEPEGKSARDEPQCQYRNHQPPDRAPPNERGLIQNRPKQQHLVLAVEPET